MTRKSAVCLAILALGTSLLAQHERHDAVADVHKLKGMGEVHHKVTTANPEAQVYFDQGLALVYA